MTRRRGVRPEDDPGIEPWLDSRPVITLVGKTSDFHVKEVLRATLEENLAMIAESVRLSARSRTRGDLRCRAFLRRLEANPEYASGHDAAAARPAATWSCCAIPMAARMPEEVARTDPRGDRRA